MRILMHKCRGIHTYTYIHTHIHTHTYTHIHAHTQTPIQAPGHERTNIKTERSQSV